MAIHSTGHIRASDVVTDITQATGDEGCRVLARHFYLSQIQQAVTELGFDSGFDIRSWEENIPSTLKLKLPDNIVNPINIYLFNGDSCDIGASARLHVKYNFKHKGGDGFLANQRGIPNSIGDPLIQPTLDPALNGEGLFYGNIQNGMLMFSSNCGAWQKVHVEYMGQGFDAFGDEVSIPAFARQAITDYVIHKTARARMRENPAYWRAVMADHQAQLSQVGGSWQTARKRAAMMSKWERADMNAYNSTFPPFG